MSFRTLLELVADTDPVVYLDFDLDNVERTSQDSQADSVGLVCAHSSDHAHILRGGWAGRPSTSFRSPCQEEPVDRERLD
jgi:hypothetical protein